MSNTCSVYGCKTNYRGYPKATFFSLPKGPSELKDKWITALHMDDSGDISENNIFICRKHFREEDLIRVDRALQVDGKYLKYHVLDQYIAPTLFKLFSKAFHHIYFNCSNIRTF